MKKLLVSDIIIENERDQLTFDYLKKIRGDAGIQHILDTYFNGGTRPYISNIIKYAKIEVPDDALRTNVINKAEMRERVALLKKSLKNNNTT